MFIINNMFKFTKEAEKAYLAGHYTTDMAKSYAEFAYNTPKIRFIERYKLYSVASTLEVYEHMMRSVNAQLEKMLRMVTKENEDVDTRVRVDNFYNDWRDRV